MQRTHLREVDQSLALFMPGFAKPLSEWSPRALEQLAADLIEQRNVARSRSECDHVETRMMVLHAEALRRGDGIDVNLVRELKAIGADRPFSERERREKQLELPLTREKDGERSRDRNDGVTKKALPAPDRAERDGGGLER